MHQQQGETQLFCKFQTEAECLCGSFQTHFETWGNPLKNSSFLQTWINLALKLLKCYKQILYELIEWTHRSKGQNSFPCIYFYCDLRNAGTTSHTHTYAWIVDADAQTLAAFSGNVILKHR